MSAVAYTSYYMAKSDADVRRYSVLCSRENVYQAYRASSVGPCDFECPLLCLVLRKLGAKVDSANAKVRPALHAVTGRLRGDFSFAIQRYPPPLQFRFAFIYLIHSVVKTWILE